RKYAEEAVAIPAVDPALETAARRVALSRRAIAVARLQDRYERELAQVQVLTDDERARVKQGAKCLEDYQLQR
ncbi:MAG: hypothetical protein ACAI25_03185, partial [Planctomycetota bacterium]